MTNKLSRHYKHLNFSILPPLLWNKAHLVYLKFLYSGSFLLVLSHFLLQATNLFSWLEKFNIFFIFRMLAKIVYVKSISISKFVNAEFE